MGTRLKRDILAFLFYDFKIPRIQFFESFFQFLRMQIQNSFARE